VFCGQLLRHCIDTSRVCDIEFDDLDAWVGLGDGVQMALASA
jgi:predicted sugar kinase